MNDFDDIYSGFSGTRGLFPKMKYYRDVPAFMPKKEQGRNEKCKCGSGLKYKKCCGRDTVPDSERMPKRIKSEPIFVEPEVAVTKTVEEAKEPPRLISTWKELAEYAAEDPSEYYRIEVDLYHCNGWIHPKNDKKENDWMGRYYLSTHTFYVSNYQESTAVLQQCGFNVQLTNWDEVIPD